MTRTGYGQLYSLPLWSNTGKTVQNQPTSKNPDWGRITCARWFHSSFSGAVEMTPTPLLTLRLRSPRPREGMRIAPVAQLLGDKMQALCVPLSIWFYFLTCQSNHPQCLLKGLAVSMSAHRRPVWNNALTLTGLFFIEFKAKTSTRAGRLRYYFLCCPVFFLFPGQRPQSSDELIGSPGEVSAEPGQGFNGIVNPVWREWYQRGAESRRS